MGQQHRRNEKLDDIDHESDLAGSSLHLNRSVKPEAGGFPEPTAPALQPSSNFSCHPLLQVIEEALP